MITIFFKTECFFLPCSNEALSGKYREVVLYRSNPL